MKKYFIYLNFDVYFFNGLKFYDFDKLVKYKIQFSLNKV